MKKIKNEQSIAKIIVATFFGFIVLSFLSVIFRLNHLNNYTLLLIPLIVFFVNLKNFRSVHVKIFSKKVIIHFFILFFLNFNLFFQGISMGVGEYPLEFFNVDSAAYLGLLQGYLKSNSYPPINLEVLGASFKYHYGTISAAALITNLTFVKQHFALFVFVPAICAVSLYAFAYLIAKKILDTTNFWLLILTTSLMVLLVGFELNTLIPHRLYNFIFKIGTWGKQFPMVSSLMANSLIAFILYLLISSTSKSKEIFLLFVIMPFLAFCKIPYLPIILAIVCLYLVYLLYEKQHFYVYWLIPSMLVLCGASILFLSLGDNMSSIANNATNAISFGFFKEHNTTVLYTYGAFIFPLLLIIFQAKKVLSEQFVLLLIIILIPILISTFIKIDNPDYFQFFSTVSLQYALILIPISISILHNQNLIKKWFVHINLGVISMIMLTSMFYYTYLLFTQKNKTHEYVNNVIIADALRKVPTNNSLLITNDLRYPANDFQRNNKQFQLSAIWGNQCLASSKYFITQQSEDNFTSGIKINQLLQQSTWTDTLTNLIQQKNVTHILIHKNFAHCSNIPYQKIYENEAYQVYSVL